MRHWRIILGILAIVVAIIGTILTQDNTAKSMPSRDQQSHMSAAA